MSSDVTIHRQPPFEMPVPEKCRAGAAEVDITPHFGFPMAGYSISGKEGDGLYGRLFARAFYFEDKAGGRAAICVIDMMSCSRYLLERVAERTGQTCGISVDRLLIHGTHSHTGPGNFYGDSFYNTAAQAGGGFDETLANWLSLKIGDAINAAAGDLGPARVGYAEEKLWRVNWNRSHPAFKRNNDRNKWNKKKGKYPGAGAPSDVVSDPQQAWVDPRLRVMTLSRPKKDIPFGVLATFSCHSTALGTGAEYYSPDWPGYAAMTARDALTPDGAKPPIVAVGIAAAGDMTGVPPSSREDNHRPGVMREAGRLVGEGIRRVADKAIEGAGKFKVETRYAEHSVTDRRVNGDKSTKLAKRWATGMPTLAGSDEARSSIPSWIAREGMTDTLLGKKDLHWPKQEPGAGVVAFILDLTKTQPSKVYPLHVLRIGDVCYATVPGEPTAMQAFRMERDVKAALGGAGSTPNVVVLGYSGDYIGYYTTEEEHRAQHYEGSSMLYGRNAGRHIQARLANLAADSVSEPPEGATVLEPGPRKKRFKPDEKGRDHSAAPSIERIGLTVNLEWRTRGSSNWLICDGTLVSLEEERNGSWDTVQFRGCPFDDVHRFVRILRGRGGGREVWQAEITLPKEVLFALRPLRVRVHGRHEVSGFTLDVPGTAAP